MRREPGCVRTTAVLDADGFTIQQPQNETVVISDPFIVRELTGQVVVFDGSPIETANVEFLRIGTKNVLRTKTDSTGTFRMSGVPDGRYKFKVTKDGFKALTGIVVVDKHASRKAELSFQLNVGT